MNLVESANIPYVPYAGITQAFWWLPPRPYAPPIAIAGFVATWKIYDTCGGTLLLTTNPAITTETANFSETMDDGTVIDYSIPLTATLNLALTPGQVATFVDTSYYELYVTANSVITPLAQGLLVPQTCEESACC